MKADITVSLNLDFSLLRTQKQDILDLIEKLKKKKNNECTVKSLDGIIHLIDFIQDQAVDKNGLPEEVIFGKEDEDNYYSSTDEKGTTFWWKDGKIHRDDGPAIEYTDGTKFWYKDGLKHREDGPAVILDNGSKFWYIWDKKHRLDGPAVEMADGTTEWWKNGKMVQTNKAE